MLELTVFHVKINKAYVDKERAYECLGRELSVGEKKVKKDIG